MKNNILNFIVICLTRLLIGASQFFTIIFMAVYMSIDDLGTYALIVIILGYSAQLAGFNFHSFLVREMNRHSQTQWSELMFQQAGFSLISLSLVSVAVVIFTLLQILALDYLLYFYVILICTVLNTQIENFLIGASKPVAATLNLLIRSVWFVGLYLGQVFGLGTITLVSVLLFWLAAELSALVIGLIRLYLLGHMPSNLYPVNVAWIKKGVRTGAKYTTIGFMLLVVISVQRLFLGTYSSAEDAGVFHFYFSISVFIPNLLEAALYAIILPRMFAKYQDSSSTRSLGIYNWQTVGITLAAGVGLVVVYLLLPYGLQFLNRVELSTNSALFVFTAIYAVLYSASRNLHYQLYAASFDKELLMSYFTIMLIACGSSAVLIPDYGLMGAAVSLTIAGLALFTVLGVVVIWKKRVRSRCEDI